MTKLALIIYTFITSLLYTGLVAYFSTQGTGIALGYIATILIAATALIAFGREKISDYEVDKKLGEKDSQIRELKKSVKQKQAMLHSVKSKVIHVVINVNDKDELLVTMRDLATLLNENPVINNVDLDDGIDVSGYLDIVSVNAGAKS